MGNGNGINEESVRYVCTFVQLISTTFGFLELVLYCLSSVVSFIVRSFAIMDFVSLDMRELASHLCEVVQLPNASLIKMQNPQI